MGRPKWMKEIYEQECLIPKACMWYVVNEIKEHDSNKGFSLDNMQAHLRKRIFHFNKTLKKFSFYFGANARLENVLDHFVDDSVLGFNPSSGYFVTEKGDRELERRLEHVRKYFPEIKTGMVPSDLGAIDNVWRLLEKVVSYFDKGEGLTIPEIKSNVKKTLHEIHANGNNPEFIFFLGYQKTIPVVLEDLCALKQLAFADGKYSVTEFGKERLEETKSELAKYCGVRNLDEFLKSVLK